MKSKNLQILQEHNIRVPKFTVVQSVDDVDSTFLFFLPSGQTYAVRSSFDGEDSSHQSYAGQFDTFLNVEKWELKKRVKQVLDSVSKENVRQYRNAQNIDCSLHGEVIIQEMVQADFSGVIFTANPLGILNETVIVVGQGLGCNVVEDKTETSSYYYNQDDGIYYCEQHGESPLLSDTLLQELIGLSKEIKSIFNYEADIEFAIKDDVVYILQTRPITTLDMSNPIILDNSNIVESYPGISLPLTQDFVRTIYHEIFYNLVKRISKDKELANDMDKYLVNMTDVANWRIYYRISNWYAVLKLLPFSKRLISVWQNMLGVNNTTVSAPCAIKVSFRNKLTVVSSVLHYLRKCPAYMDELNNGFSLRLNEYEELIANNNKPSELLQVYESIRTDIMEDWDLTLINDMYTFIYTALAGKKNKEFISNIKNLESMKPVYALKELIDIAEGFGMDSDRYRKAVDAYILQYGDRCLCELKLETRTYRTNPEMLEEYILRNCGSENIRRASADNSKQKNSFFIKRAKVGIKNREISRMNRSRIFGLARTIFDKIGAYMVAHNLLDVAEDVYYLHIDELQAPQDYRNLVQQRKAEYADFTSVPAYTRLVFSDKVINKPNHGMQSRVLMQNNELFGIATSIGKVRGEALVIDEPSDKLDTTGKILVTKSTDPGWVFLIQNAIGIVAEKGSLLSHTAIVSRELCKPAVVNVKDCTKLIHSGDIIELDAENGRISILSSGCSVCEK